jgi:hypothetical protein
VQLLERFGTVLPDGPNAYEQWKQLVMQHQITGKSVHDARIAAQCIVWSISHLITLNPHDFLRFRELTLVTPAEALASIPAA